MYQHSAAFDVVDLGRVRPVKQFRAICPLVTFQRGHMGEINRFERVVDAGDGSGVPGPPHTRDTASNNSITVKTEAAVKKRIFLVMLDPSVVTFEIFKATALNMETLYYIKKFILLNT